MAALRTDRVTHAYLFSGPRGCGKTTSARILARCLNCAQGPTDTPCGECESCRELATGGSGSLDVVEIDAASHNGVDDARELRERATFAPVRDRYKIFILDEAHMVTPQGFNALLKLVEEPPEHVKFIFATTEPERVIGTIRSRTHHYPFRLVPGDVMVPFLADLCERESIRVGDGVLPLVVRAGGGSVRDSLSVLDQLMAGCVDGEVGYDRATALLGYTDTALLDEVVDALHDGDGARAFSAVERMVESGHDPRRFVEDFLQRLRDLLIMTIAGESARALLVGVPKEQIDGMFTQAEAWGGLSLSRAADITDEALRQMVGATSPRLQLELLIGRLLLVDQLSSTSVSSTDQAATAHSDENALTSSTMSPGERALADLRRSREAERAAQTRGEGMPAARFGTESIPSAAPTGMQSSSSRPNPLAAPELVGKSSPADEHGSLASRWDEFLDEIERLRPGWRQPIAANVRPAAEDNHAVTVAFAKPQQLHTFVERGHLSVFAQAFHAVAGVRKEVKAILDTEGNAPEKQSPPAQRANSSPEPASSLEPPVSATSPESTVALGNPSPDSNHGSVSAESPESIWKRNTEVRTAEASQYDSSLCEPNEWARVAVPGGGVNQFTSGHQSQPDPDSKTQNDDAQSQLNTQAGEPELEETRDLGESEQSASPSQLDPTNVANDADNAAYEDDSEETKGLARNIVQGAESPQQDVSLDVAGVESENEWDGERPIMYFDDDPQFTELPELNETDTLDEEEFDGGARMDDSSVEVNQEIGVPAVQKVFDARIVEQLPADRTEV